MIYSFASLQKDINIKINPNKLFSWDTRNFEIILKGLYAIFKKNKTQVFARATFFDYDGKSARLDNINYILFYSALLAALSDKISNDDLKLKQLCLQNIKKGSNPQEIALAKCYSFLKEHLAGYQNLVDFYDFLLNARIWDIELRNYNLAKNSTQVFLENMQSLKPLDQDSYFTYKDHDKIMQLVLKTTKNYELLPLLGLIKSRDDKNIELNYQLLQASLISRNIFGFDTDFKAFAALFFDLEKCNPLHFHSKLKNFLFKASSKNMLKAKLKTALNNPAIKSTIRLMLFVLELRRRSKYADFLDNEALRFNYALEHILPQKYFEQWSEIVLGYDKLSVDARIQSIGNLTLLTPKLNAAIGNKKWSEKIQPIEKGKLSLALSELFINKELLKKKQWDLEWIAIREDELLVELLELWPLCFYHF